ncbi:MAG: hypothetical protein CL677_02140 [Bdellovibrionaceae bacterium]|nr:hypothetical protein [Pseudobdellovibrionaceae bacterium]
MIPAWRCILKMEFDSRMNTKFEVIPVLIRPKYSSNIGTAARAAANLGSPQFIVVEPKCTIDENAYKGAAGAQMILDEAIVYNSTSEYFNRHSSCLRIGLTARSGKNRRVEELSTLSNEVKSTKADRIHLIFGPEDHGLSKEDLDQCHLLATLPSFGTFTSFNLAQAVLLSLYIVKSMGPILTQPENSSDLGTFDDSTLKSWLKSMGIQLNAPKANAFYTLKNMLLRSQPTKKEAALFEKIVRQTIRLIRE